MADDLLQCGLDCHHAGLLEEARQAYRQLLEERPDDPNALYLLAALAYQGGSPGEALQLARRALAAGADPAECHNLMGLAFQVLGEAKEAEASFQSAIAIRESPGFLVNLANLWSAQGRFDEAIPGYDRALAQDPHHAGAHYNLGNALRAKGRLEQAAISFRQAVDLDPTHANALAALGQVLHALERDEEAIPYLEKALALLPGDAVLRHQLGESLHQLKRLPEALAAYRQALALNPGLSQAWYAAGCAEASREEWAEAVTCFRKALALVPDWAAAQHNLGQALVHLGQVDEALELMRRAAAGAAPELPRATIAVVITASPAAGNQGILDTRSAFAELDLPVPDRQRVRARPHAPPLRIGYLSSLFDQHNYMKPVWGLINRHDRRQFSIHLFSDSPAAAITHGYQAQPDDQFHDIARLSNEKAAQLIEKSAIDLLVDLNGYSRFRRLPLFALRPAPIIVGSFNLIATTGMRAFDYLIADREVIPPEEEQFYCEKILRVPGSYLSFEVTYPVPPVAAPPCLAKDAVTFGCLATLYKINPAVVAAWSRILHQAPRSSLILKNSAMRSPANRQFVHGLFREHGIHPERVRLEGPSGHYQFLQQYDEIDVALDTFPCNGGTTTTEAIWQGVPVIAFRGDRWAARTSASILRAANLGAFVAPGLEEYISMAVDLANSPATPARLAELRRNMRAQLSASPVCDMRKITEAVEQLYLQIWQEAVHGS
jgi:predicted O-linked N-acetylglucosamine transferase (SPINDLY family)